MDSLNWKVLLQMAQGRVQAEIIVKPCRHPNHIETIFPRTIVQRDEEPLIAPLEPRHLNFLLHSEARRSGDR